MTPRELGLLELDEEGGIEREKGFVQRPYIPDHHGMDLAGVKRKLVASIAKHAAVAAAADRRVDGFIPVCAIQAPCLERLGPAPGGFFDRKSRIVCREWTATKGETLTVVAFHRATQLPGGPGMASTTRTFPQHTILRGLLVNATGVGDSAGVYYYGDCDATTTQSGNECRKAQGCDWDDARGMVCVTD